MSHLAAVLQEPGDTALAARGPLAGYRIEGVVGRGRHSIVYLAQRPESCGRSRVALKVARRARLQSIGAAPEMRNEFAAMAALAHPHVVEVFDCGFAGGADWLAMEYAQGGNLEARRRGRHPEAGAFELLHQAASALSWIHRKGWVHRDVKPANLFLRKDGSIALGDFGTACRRDAVDTSPPGAMVGTPRYAAPEQSEGAPAGPAADVYGLGVCLYEMLSGRPLFPGETLAEVLGQHLVAPVPQLAQELAAWQPLLDAMLAKDPGRRLPDGQAVVLQLERARQCLSRPHGGGSSHASRNPP
jgi:serine/threonine-protein kinase PpkA